MMDLKWMAQQVRLPNLLIIIKQTTYLQHQLVLTMLLILSLLL